MPTDITEATSDLIGSFSPPVNWIGAAGPDGDFHVHLSFELVSEDEFGEPVEPPLGVYGFPLRLVSSRSDIAASSPLVLAFNFGLSETEFETGADALVDEILIPFVV